MADATIDLLKSSFRQLRLPSMSREFERLARDAAATNQNYFEFLLRLAESELATRAAATISRRIKDAKFPVLKDFEIYDFSGSSVLKCEAWDFSLFWRSQSFCYHSSGDVSDHGGAMARITIDVDLPPEVEITGYQRYQDGHGLEVRWPLPARCRCEKCGHDDVAHIEFKTIPQAIRDLNLWEQPCFWIYQVPFHRCARCNYRQHIIPPFKRKDVSYTYRFEQFVLRSLIGSTAEEVARRLGISAETVDRIVENQLTEDRQIDPQRVVTDIGLDELSLKKRHRLYVTLMTDLSDPTRPQILAVERGRDTTATLKCLDRLTQEQRQQVRTHRVDMGPAYPAACALRLPHSRAVTDRFHVAITTATKIRTNPYSRFGPATADRGSREIRDQPRNPPKYTEKRIRINFPFPCRSVLLTLNFFEPCANSWAKTKYEPLSIGSYKLFICQKLNAPNFRR